jgi:hypothetical protein
MKPEQSCKNSAFTQILGHSQTRAVVNALELHFVHQTAYQLQSPASSFFVLGGLTVVMAFAILAVQTGRNDPPAGNRDD